MVNEKPIRLTVLFAILAQRGGHGFAFLPGIDEHQALFPPGMFKNIPQPRVGILGCLVGGIVQRLQRFNVGALCPGLHILYIKMLHAQPPAALFRRHSGDEGAAACA